MKSFDAIAVLGGGLIKDKSGKWRTTNFDEGDNFGALGDRLRVVAASFLYKSRSTSIIVLGGRGQLKNISDAPPVSEVIKNELVEMGVAPKDIICEKRSGSTFEQLRELADIAGKKGFKSLTIITNDYHVPRIRAMIKFNPALTKTFSYCKLAFKSAESVLLKHDSKTWQKLIDTAYKSDTIKKRIVSESAGVKQIKEGTYDYGNKNLKP